MHPAKISQLPLWAATVLTVGACATLNDIDRSVEGALAVPDVCHRDMRGVTQNGNIQQCARELMPKAVIYGTAALKKLDYVLENGLVPEKQIGQARSTRETIRESCIATQQSAMKSYDTEDRQAAAEASAGALIQCFFYAGMIMKGFNDEAAVNRGKILGDAAARATYGPYHGDPGAEFMIPPGIDLGPRAPAPLDSQSCPDLPTASVC